MSVNSILGAENAIVAAGQLMIALLCILRLATSPKPASYFTLIREAYEARMTVAMFTVLFVSAAADRVVITAIRNIDPSLLLDSSQAVWWVIFIRGILAVAVWAIVVRALWLTLRVPAEASPAEQTAEEMIREARDQRAVDRGKEQTDRDEGHDHRSNIERKLDADTELRAEERQADREERKQERKDDREERRDERGA